MKGDNLRFEILKQLRISPTYGYNLHKIFARRQYCQKPVELYKSIQMMKDAHFLNAQLVEYKHGQKKEILSLTSEGEISYYEHTIESAKIFFNTVMEQLVRKTANVLFDKMAESQIKISESTPISVLLYLDYLPFMQQIQFVITFFEKIKSQTFLYIPSNPGNPSEGKEWLSLMRMGYQINLFDPNLTLKNHSIDIILEMGQNKDAPFSTLLDLQNPESWLRLLKENGIVILGFIREKERTKPSILLELVKEFFDELPEQLQEPIFQEFQSFLDISRIFKKKVTNQEIQQLITDAFQETKQVQIED
jgi:DNA-binding PadR family transcriptional regulator